MYKADEINIVYCCSDLFSEVCAVSVVSLFDNNRHLKDINVYIINDNIRDINKRRILDIAERYNRNIIFIELPNPSIFYEDERFTIKSLGHTYARMILGDIIPDKVERLLSLDSDTIVLGNIDGLWNIDMGGYPIAGVDDCMGRVALVKTQHLKADSKHCNAGMYLIDLDVWRHENWTALFKKYIVTLFDKGYSLGGYEEEVITHVLGERMMILPPKYNLMTLEQVFSYEELLRFRQPIKYYSQEEIEEAINSPVITHTTNFFYVKKRIYENGSDHPMREQYVKYRRMTPWKDEQPMTVSLSVKQKFQKNIWHFMPKVMAIALGSFVRNEIRPKLEKKRDDE